MNPLDRIHQQSWALPGSGWDRLMGVLRVVLPVTVVVLVVLMAVAPVVSGRDISFILSKDQVDMAHERMRVTRAVYRGRDDNEQPFELDARSAVQATSNNPVVKLDTLNARMQLDDGPATVVAPAGRYDMDNQKIALDGPVLVRRADGSRMTTRNVAIDMNTKRIASNAPVTGTMPTGTYSADHMTADLDSRVVVLTGHTRLHFVQSGAKAPR